MTAETRPAPLTTPDCDLRGNTFMPLHGDALFASDFDARANDAEFRAFINLIWSAWKQVPAASFPNDDLILAKAAGLGRDVKKWLKLKPKCMSGFVECSDRRLYHPFLASLALESFEYRTKYEATKAGTRARVRRKRQRDARAAKAAEPAGHETPDETRYTDNSNPEALAAEATNSTLTLEKSGAAAPNGVGLPEPPEGRDLLENSDDETPNETPDETRYNGRRKDTGVHDIGSVLRTGASPPPAADARLELWKQGVPLVRALLGKSDAASRTILGRFLRDARDDCPRVLAVLQQAADLRPADPAAWITAALQNRRQTRADESRAKLARFIAGIDDDPEPPPQPLPALLR